MPCGIGHSERRTLFHETSKLVADKTRAAIDAGLSVILCVGETLEEREAGKTKQVVEDQLKPVIEVLKEADWRCVYRHSSNFSPPPVPATSTIICGVMAEGRDMDLSMLTPSYALFCSKVVIAYEPVWAIGTGKVATSAQAQATHADIRSYLSTAVSPAVAENTRIIYGGSVNAANSKELGTSWFARVTLRVLCEGGQLG